jgi:hypothetical protein
VITIPSSNAVVVAEHKREIKVFVTQECGVKKGHRARPEVPGHSGDSDLIDQTSSWHRRCSDGLRNCFQPIKLIH